MTDFTVAPTYEDPNTAFGQKLVALVEEEENMTEYEHQFLEDMVDKFEKGSNFTDPQIELVNKLYEKYCY